MQTVLCKRPGSSFHRIISDHASTSTPGESNFGNHTSSSSSGNPLQCLAGTAYASAYFKAEENDLTVENVKPSNTTTPLSTSLGSIPFLNGRSFSSIPRSGGRLQPLQVLNYSSFHSYVTERNGISKGISALPLNRRKTYPSKSSSSLSLTPSCEFHVTSRQGRRMYMEDTTAHRTFSNGRYHLFGVFDGHGGKLASEYCATHLLDTICHHLGGGETALPKDMKLSPTVACKALVTSIMETEKTFMELAAKHQWRDGTTVLVCIYGDDGLCHVAHTGDTRMVYVTDGLITSRRTCVVVTDDHRPDRPSEEQRIISQGGRVKQTGLVARLSPGNIAVSRSLGDYLLKSQPLCKNLLIPDPEVTSITLDKSVKFVVIGTDGVWDAVTPQQCGEMLKKCTRASEASVLVANTAYSNGSQDNITALVIRVN